MAAMGDLFAPAYNRNDPASVANVDAWMAQNFSMTNPKVEQTRQPVSFNTGNPAGMVDPEALRVLAQGGPYDMNARRNAIAAAAAPKAAAPAAQQPAYYGQGGVVNMGGVNAPVMGGYDSLGVTPPAGMISQPYGGLGLSDWNTFVSHVGLDAANQWASQQFMRAPEPPTYQDSYGGGSGTGGEGG
jgi:hypothetical protein